MRALEELPTEAKDTILPYIVLQRWASSSHFENTLSRLDAAINGRLAVVDITRKPNPSGDKRKPVHDTIDELRNPANNFGSWYDFISDHDNFIPSLQIQDPSLIKPQVYKILELDRGCVIRMPESIFSYANYISTQISEVSQIAPFHFILDYQHKRRDILTQTASASEIIRAIKQKLPFSTFSVAASTFPSSLVDVSNQDIYERQFHDQVAAQVGKDYLVYSDRASVRAEQGGGGGTPAPRIDYPLPEKWLFFRQPDFDEDEKQHAYKLAAQDAVNCEFWEDLNVWGTGQIIDTANGTPAITSPAASTAVRIHLHMYRQSQLSPGPIEKPWVD